MSEGLSDEDLERLAQRVSDLVFHKIMRRLAKAAAVSEACASPDTRQSSKVQPSAAAFEAVRAVRRRKGVF